jgi:undecaprenyl-diphosphatase
LAVAGYLLLARKQAAAWLMLIAVFGGIALSDLLKFSFARPRPDIVSPAVRVFTTSFPSGQATLSAITYLTIGALLARSQSSPRIGVYFIVLAALKAGGDSETRRGRGLGRYWSELQRQPLNDLQT